LAKSRQPLTNRLFASRQPGVERRRAAGVAGIFKEILIEALGLGKF
jgi:hypothetical protein